ncbi:MAG: hypothetical protein ACOX0Z_02620 [Candidatus Nanosyncoccaceae bacterium]|jgi:hypothetical protein
MSLGCYGVSSFKEVLSIMWSVVEFRYFVIGFVISVISMILLFKKMDRDHDRWVEEEKKKKILKKCGVN